MLKTTSHDVSVIDAVAAGTSTTYIICCVDNPTLNVENQYGECAEIYSHMYTFTRSVLKLVYSLLSSFFVKMHKTELQNKIVVITGAYSTIGTALAQKFYTRGCHLILIGNDLNQLDQMKLHLLSLQSQCLTHTPSVMQIDLCELNNVQYHVKNILKLYGSIDILINNANIHFTGEVIHTTLCTDMEIMSNNYFSQIALTKAVLGHMLENISGHIVFVSSAQGICTDPLYSSFGASQHALLIFANTLREEVQESNIKVTTICIPKMLTENIEKHLSSDIEMNKTSNIVKSTISEVIKAVEYQKLNVIIEPLYIKISLLIKELFRSKF